MLKRRDYMDDKSINIMTLKTDNYETESLTYFLRGNLKGYVNGRITFDNEDTHELLYRFYDPANGDSNVLISIDYGFRNPMVDVYWYEIQAEITKAVCALLTAQLKSPKVPVTTEQALSCLEFKSDKRVHSFTKELINCFSGADLDFARVNEIISAAASVNLLFASDGFEMDHNIAAWDHKYQQWFYFECIPDKINGLLMEVRNAGN
jgi:hypothetical protein